MVDNKSNLLPDGPPDPDEEPSLSPAASGTARYLAAVGMTAVATIMAVAVDNKVTIPNLSLVFVVPVIIAGVSLGLGPSLCAGVLGALAFNFFLTEPRYSLAVDDPANIWAIGLLFVVGLITSGVAFTSHRRAAEAALLTRQIGVLQAGSRQLVAADSAETAGSIACRTLFALFRVPAVVLLISEEKVAFLEQAGDLAPQETDLEAARLSSTTETVMRSGVYPNIGSRFDFWPFETAAGRKVVLGLAFDPGERPANPDQLVNIVARVAALVLDREKPRDGQAGSPG